MFGKGGGPLNAWIKEFCELVFIQTLQAFIFALVMGFIISILNYQVTMEQTDRNTSLGIICVVALTSIFKVEDIARRIFGYGPTKADHGNAVQSIGKSMMALKMGKNLLDNGKKIVGGAGAAFGAHSKKVKALKRMNSRMKALDTDNGMGSAWDSSGNAGTGNMSASDSLANIDGGTSNGSAIGQSATGAGLKVSSASASAPSSNKGKGRIPDYEQRAQQIKDEYDEKMKEIDKQKRQGIKQMVSGFAETGAAMVGFTAGTAMSVASTNDWGGAVKDGITWAGTADAVTAGAVDLTASTTEFFVERGRNAKKLADEYEKNYKSQLKAAEKMAADSGKEIDAEYERELKRRARKNARSMTRDAHSVKAQKKVFDDARARLDKMQNSGKASETDGGVFK